MDAVTAAFFLFVGLTHMGGGKEHRHHTLTLTLKIASSTIEA